MISTLIRGNLPQEPGHREPKGKKNGFFIYFQDKEIQISSKEKELFKNFQSNQLLLGMLTGQIDSWLNEMNNKASKDLCAKPAGGINSGHPEPKEESVSMAAPPVPRHEKPLVPKFE